MRPMPGSQSTWAVEKRRTLERQNDLSAFSVENMSNLHHMKKQRAAKKLESTKFLGYFWRKLLFSWILWCFEYLLTAMVQVHIEKQRHYFANKVRLVKAMVFPVVMVRVGLWRKLSAKELMLLNCGVGEDSWESLGLQGDPTSPFWRRSALGFLWKEWC